MEETQIQENITVAVRIRPFVAREEGYHEAWERTSPTSLRQVGTDRDYVFDRVFDQNNSTNEIFDVLAEKVLWNSMEGFNGCIFCYGQTGSGKTFTIHGNRQTAPGIVPLSVETIFAYIRETPDSEFLLRCQYLEIYNESINDLLTENNNNLAIQEDKHHNAKIVGATEVVCKSPEQVFSLLLVGEAHRQVASTNYNLRSSRSHSMQPLNSFRLTVEAKERTARAVNVGTVNIIDLAGSESAKVHMTDNAFRKREMAFINKSLLTLGSVILKLSNLKKNDHVPYRDSKLTRILKPALEGNSKVTIICNISPSSDSVEESMSTILFAQRAKKIKQVVHKNGMKGDNALIMRYENEIHNLQERIRQMEMKLQEDSKFSRSDTVLKSQIDDLSETLHYVQDEKMMLDKQVEELLRERVQLKEQLTQFKSKILHSENVNGIYDTEAAIKSDQMQQYRRSIRLRLHRTSKQLPREGHNRMKRCLTFANPTGKEIEAIRNAIIDEDDDESLDSDKSFENKIPDIDEVLYGQEGMLWDKLDELDDILTSDNPMDRVSMALNPNEIAQMHATIFGNQPQEPLIRPTSINLDVPQGNRLRAGTIEQKTEGRGRSGSQSSDQSSKNMMELVRIINEQQKLIEVIYRQTMNFEMNRKEEENKSLRLDLELLRQRFNKTEGQGIASQLNRQCLILQRMASPKLLTGTNFFRSKDSPPTRAKSSEMFRKSATPNNKSLSRQQNATYQSYHRDEVSRIEKEMDIIVNGSALNKRPLIMSLLEDLAIQLKLRNPKIGNIVIKGLVGIREQQSVKPKISPRLHLPGPMVDCYTQTKVPYKLSIKGKYDMILEFLRNRIKRTLTDLNSETIQSKLEDLLYQLTNINTDLPFDEEETNETIPPSVRVIRPVLQRLQKLHGGLADCMLQKVKRHDIEEISTQTNQILISLDAYEELQNKLSDKESEIDTLNRRILQLSDDLSMQKDIIRSIETRKLNLQNNIVNMQVQKEEIQRSLNIQVSKARVAQNTNRELVARMSMKSTLHAECREQIDGLQQETGILRKSINEQQVALNNLLSKYNAQKLKYKQTKMNYTQQKSTITDLRNQIQKSFYSSESDSDRKRGKVRFQTSPEVTAKQQQHNQLQRIDEIAANLKPNHVPICNIPSYTRSMMSQQVE